MVYVAELDRLVLRDKTRRIFANVIGTEDGHHYASSTLVLDLCSRGIHVTKRDLFTRT